MDYFHDDIDERILVLQLDSAVNTDACHALVQKIEGMIENGLRGIIADCSELEYISSSGVGILLRLYRYVNQHGSRITVAGANSEVAEVLQLTRFDELLGIHQDIETAREEIAKSN